MEDSNLTHLDALEQFVVANEDLLELEERIGRFNVFDALRVARVEIRHSNFLAWLLDPAESHGQGDLFTLSLLMDLLARTPPGQRPVSPVLLDGADLAGCEVVREWRGIDLLVHCKDPEFLVVIENKVGSREGRDQLGRYEKTAREQFPGVPCLFVFLTVDGDEPSRPEWIQYTYGDIHRVLHRCRRTNRGALGDDVAVVLDHYLRLLGSRFMNDPKIDELCQRIYKTHRQALDLIYERAGVGQSGLVGEVAQWVQDHDDYDLVRQAPRRVTFTPTAWKGALPPIGEKDPAHTTQWILCEVFFDKKERCRLWLRAWPCTDDEVRRRAIERIIQDAGEFGLKPSQKNFTDKWTQLDNHLIIKWKDDEPDASEMLSKLEALLEKHVERYTRAVHAAGEAIADT